MIFEYKVVLAPKRPSRVKGLKRGEDKFAASLAQMMNKYAADGWEYQRTDTLPVESRSGLASKTTTFQNMLVFRRPVEVAQTEGTDLDEAEVEVHTALEEEPAYEEQPALDIEPAAATYEQPAAYEQPTLYETPAYQEPAAQDLPPLYAEPAAAYEPQVPAFDPTQRVEPTLTAPGIPPEPRVPPMPLTPETAAETSSDPAVETADGIAGSVPEYETAAEPPAEPETAAVHTLPDNVAEFDPVRPVFRRRSSGGA